MRIVGWTLDIPQGSRCRRMHSSNIQNTLLICLLCISYTGWTQGTDALTFSFYEKAPEGCVNSRVKWPYEENGIRYGLTGQFQLHKSYVGSDESFAFWTQVPEGNYRIGIVVGDQDGSSNTTIKAESRRLMVYDYTTEAGMVDTVFLMVNVRSAQINETDSIRLKSREFDYLNWDQNLTLEFGGKRPCVRSIVIEKEELVPTIFLAGNSTVVDQEKEPWASWGQIFPMFLKPGIVVANFAESGESLKSFIRSGRLDKIASLIKPGDYLFVEFAHNDQKPGENYVDPYTSYKKYLMKFVSLARENKATPVLVTATHRRKFDENGNILNSLGEYPGAMRKLAEKESIMLIDLNTMSKTLYEALGPEGAKRAFVHYEAGTFPWQEDALADDTHFSTYGAWQLAKCIVKGISDYGSSLKSHLKRDMDDYDPKKPDKYTEWKWPVNKNGSVAKQDGS